MMKGAGDDMSTLFGCSYRQADYILPDFVNLVSNGVRLSLADGSYLLNSNLTSAIQRGNNADVSVEFTFTRPARVVGIAFPQLQTASIYR